MSVPYHHSTLIHNTRAAEKVVPIIKQYLRFNSVLDVGCGTGTWLKVFSEEHGISDFVGIDGDYVDEKKLVVTKDRFIRHDLRQPFDLRRSFDLLLCLEVAEHLPEKNAKGFIASLCNHSDNIIFSAAIPGQGGQNHINEQWPTYWEKQFRFFGYTKLDIIRPEIWNIDSVEVWYRQNIFWFTNDSELIKEYQHFHVSATIHPELWGMKLKSLSQLQVEVTNFDRGGAGIMRSLRALVNAFKNKF